MAGSATESQSFEHSSSLPRQSPRTAGVLFTSRSIESYMQNYSRRRKTVFYLQLIFLGLSGYGYWSAGYNSNNSLSRDQVMIKSALLGVSVQSLLFCLIFLCQSKDCIVSKFKHHQLALLNSRLEDKSYGTPEETSNFTKVEQQAFSSIQTLQSRLCLLRWVLGLGAVGSLALDFYDVFQHAQTIRLSITSASAWALFSILSCYITGVFPQHDNVDLSANMSLGV